MANTTMIKVKISDRQRINDRTNELIRSKEGQKIKRDDICTHELVTYLLDKLEKLERSA